MKNSIKVLSILLIGALMSGCAFNKGNQSSNNDNTESGSSYIIDGEAWPEGIKDELNEYLGELIPFVQLDEESLTHDYNVDYGCYYLYDDSEVDAFANIDYANKLILAGYTEKETDYGTGYFKDVPSDNHAQLYFGWEEATSSTTAGNFITIYLDPIISEQLLLNNGYEKHNGWPTDIVESTLEGSNLELEGVELTADWYVVNDLYTDDDEGESYYYALLAVQAECGDEMAANCLAAGIEYDDIWDCYYDEDTEVEVDIVEKDGWTLIDIYGPTVYGDVAGETINTDGSITVEFTFEGNLADGKTFDGEGFVTEHASITFNKGEANTAPTYYSNGNTIRCYAKNTISFECSTGYGVSSVVLTIGSSNNKKWDNAASLYTLNSGTAVATEETTTITGINTDPFTIGLGMDKTGGNIAFSKIVVTLTPAY